MSIIYTPPTGSGITLVVFASVFIPLTLLAAVLRIWARQMLHRKLAFNDYSLIIGAVLAITNNILSILAVVYGGAGRHQTDVLAQYPTLAKITLALALVWTAANTFVKLSIVHLYLVIFPPKWFRFTTYFVIFLICGYCLTNVVLNLLTCQPVAFNWNKTIPGGHCNTHEAPFLSSAIINMCIDIMIVALPMPMLWNLQMSLKKKWSLTVVFGLGILICALSAVRIKAIAALDYTDFSYSVIPDGVYSVLEPCLGTVSACLPVLQPISNRISTSRFFTTLRGSTKRDRSTVVGKNSGTPATIGSGGGVQKGFNRLNEHTASTDDDYPLIELGHVNPAKIYTQSGTFDGSINGIGVKKDWDVTTRARRN